MAKGIHYSILSSGESPDAANTFDISCWGGVSISSSPAITVYVLATSDVVGCWLFPSARFLLKWFTIKWWYGGLRIWFNVGSRNIYGCMVDVSKLTPAQRQQHAVMLLEHYHELCNTNKPSSTFVYPPPIPNIESFYQSTISSLDSESF